MQALIPIAIQLGIAAAVLHVLRWHVLPVLGRVVSEGEGVGEQGHGAAALILDVWLPVALIVPLLFTVAWVDYSVRGGGWGGLGGPMVFGYIALGMAAVGGRGRFEESAGLGMRAAFRGGIFAGVSGLILLLLGAAHVMHILVGQIAFAIVAVLLWMNTPRVAGDGDADDEQSGMWRGMVLVVLGSALMGAAALWVEPGLRPWSVAAGLLHGAIALGLMAFYVGRNACVRVGVWAAALGPMAALGVMSITHMLPQVVEMARGDSPNDVRYVAYGFGGYAIEASLLLVLPLAMYGVLLLGRKALRRVQ